MHRDLCKYTLPRVNNTSNLLESIDPTISWKDATGEERGGFSTHERSEVGAIIVMYIFHREIHLMSLLFCFDCDLFSPSTWTVCVVGREGEAMYLGLTYENLLPPALIKQLYVDKRRYAC